MVDRRTPSSAVDHLYSADLATRVHAWADVFLDAEPDTLHFYEGELFWLMFVCHVQRAWVSKSLRDKLAQLAECRFPPLLTDGVTILYCGFLEIREREAA